MAICPDCSNHVSSDVINCPECGVALQNGASTDELPSPEDDAVDSILLNAYLLKLRGKFDEAIEECIRALRKNPDNPVAHSLSGDIYFEQGKIEDAIRWYELALDLNPDSEADRAKLKKLIHLQAEEKASKKDFVAQLSDRIYTPPTAKAFSAIILILVIMVAWLLLYNPFNSEPNVSTSVSPLPVKSTKEADGGIAKNREDNSGPLLSQQELALLSRLNASSNIATLHLSINSVSVDPRNNSGIVTFVGPISEGEDPYQTLLRDCLTVVREAFHLDVTLSGITVKAIYPVSEKGQWNPELVFIGEISREKAASLDESNSYSEQSSAFENTWLNPLLHTKR